MSVSVRRFARFDARDAARLLNEIIAAGGTTAITDPVAPDALSDWMFADREASASHVAEDESGAIVGFQWIGPHPDLPEDACDIATFVKSGKTQLGIGSRLFAATADAARACGYAWINAAIRADNAGGIAYYQSRGFRAWDHLTGVALDDGRMVDKVLMRFDLD